MIKFITLTLFNFVLLSQLAIATDSDANIQNTATWQKTEYGVSFSLKQLLTDQVNAFYIGRGFTLEQIKPYANTCVYTVILRNDNTSDRIDFVRHHWRILHDGKSQAPKKNQDWLTQWKIEGVTASALIGFKFAQLPERQSYAPNGDWNQGMLSIALPVGSQFDLVLNWHSQKQPYQMVLTGVNCV